MLGSRFDLETDERRVVGSGNAEGDGRLLLNEEENMGGSFSGLYSNFVLVAVVCLCAKFFSDGDELFSMEIVCLIIHLTNDSEKLHQVYPQPRGEPLVRKLSNDPDVNSSS